MSLKASWYNQLLFGALVVGAASCGKAEKQSESANEAFALNAPPPPAAPAEPVGGANRDTPLPAQVGPPAAATRLLIYHAEVRLKATTMLRAAASLDSLVRRNGGYLSAATETRADGEWRQETTIRVPPLQFQVLLNSLTELGTIEEKKLSTDDVTAEHADVAARLQAKRAVERQYTVLLAKAQKIKDILDIEEKIGEVREEIEATESRLKSLNDEVAYSTITLTLYQPLPQSIPDAPVVSLGSRATEAFYDGWQLFVSLLLGILYLWPLVLVAGFSGWWLWRRRAVIKPIKPVDTTKS